MLRDTERPKEAEAAHAEALAIFKQLVAEFPNRPEFRQELAEQKDKDLDPLREREDFKKVVAELETTVKKN